MNKVGIHCSNKMHRDLHRMVLLGGSHLTFLHEQRSLDVTMPGQPRRRLLEVWRERYGDGVMLMRVYTPDWTTLDPQAWAAHCVALYDEVKHLTQHLTFANEQNLPDEAPSQAPHHPIQYFWSKEWYGRIAAWNERVIDALRAARPEMKIHWPAFAPGHSEDQDDNGDGTIGFEICRRAIEKCDVLDVHCYWHNADELYNQWEWFGGRFVRAHRIFPQMPIFVSECGGFQGQSAALGDQMPWYLSRLYDYDYVIGATPFIWDSGPEHDINRWWGNERLIQAVTAMPKPSAPMPVKPLPGPSPNEPPPTVQLSPVDPTSLVVDLRTRLPTRGEARYEKRDPAYVDTVIFHWASDTVRDYTPLEIAQYQTGPSSYIAFPEIAYHFMITWNGTIYFLNDLDERTWHAGDWNTRSIGVLACPAQDYLLTDAQVLSARKLMRWLREALGGRELALKGHSEVRDSPCPGPGWARNKARILAVQLPTYPFEYHYVLLGQTPQGIVPWSWIEAMRDYIRTFRVTVGFSHDHAMMASERTPVRHITIIGSPDAEVPVSLEVEEMLRASGALVNRVMGKTAEEIKAELDRRAREGKPYG